MSGRLVVKRYVKALYETAENEGLTDVIENDMSVLDKILIEAPAIRQYCQKRHASVSSEIDFINTAFVPYVEKYTARTLVTAVENGRLAAIPLMPFAFKMLMEEKGDKTEVLVESAVELEPEIMANIKIKMEERTGREIIFKTKIIPEILGGFRIFWQNKIIDMSALGRLKKIRQILK